MADFTVIVGEHRIQVHKALLSARSPVFSAMLEPHTEEYRKNSVKLYDIDYEVCFLFLTANSTVINDTHISPFSCMVFLGFARNVIIYVHWTFAQH